MDIVLKTTAGVALIAAAFFFLLATVGRIEWRGGRIVSATRWERVFSLLIGVVFLAASGGAVYTLREPCPPCPPVCPPINVTVNLPERTTGPIHEKEFEVPLPLPAPEETPTPEELHRYVEIWEGLTLQERTTLILNSLKEDTPIWVGPDLSPTFWGNLSEVDRDSFKELLLRSDTHFELTMPPATCPELEPWHLM